MKSIHLTINGQAVSAPEGTTVLAAAESAGIAIPTLCHSRKFKPHTNCMICTVHELKSGRLIISCATAVSEGMDIQTGDDRVRAARKDTLELLLSEHLGDCEAPCTRTCPANMNIPLMIRQIVAGDYESAIQTIKNDIALPAVLGRICPAPCEKGCHRKQFDAPLSICSLKRFAADTDLAKELPFKPHIPPKTGKKTAVIGAGAAGLSAAYYIIRAGHDCTLFESDDSPGGLLRTAVPEDRLPREVLNAEIELLLSSGVECMTGKALGRDFTIDELRKEFDAVVIACGVISPDDKIDNALEYTSQGIKIDRDTFGTSIPGVFAGGNSVAEGKMAIRAAAHGKLMAQSLDRYLMEGGDGEKDSAFNSVIGKLNDEERAEYVQEAGDYSRIEANDGFPAGFSAEEAMKESERCFHCDCRKPVSCKLRQYAAEYGADQKKYKFGDRKQIKRIVQHDLIVYEPGKCIKCNLCIDIANEAGEELGLAFVNRGFDVKVAVPFDESLKRGLAKTAEACANACPTAALALRKTEER